MILFQTSDGRTNNVVARLDAQQVQAVIFAELCVPHLVEAAAAVQAVFLAAQTQNFEIAAWAHPTTGGTDFSVRRVAPRTARKLDTFPGNKTPAVPSPRPAGVFFCFGSAESLNG
jgi:hypothetical protein